MRFEKVNEWLGRKPKNEPLEKMREKREIQSILVFHFAWSGDIRSGRYKEGIWVGHIWRNKL